MAPNKTGIERQRTLGRMQIQVTKEIVERAIRETSGHCLIADAIKASIPDTAFVSVDLQTIRFTDRKSALRYVYLTPPDAQDALISFDQGEEISPFQFKLNRAIRISQTRKTPEEARLRKSDVVSHEKNNPIILEPPMRHSTRAIPNAALLHGFGKIRRFGLKHLKKHGAKQD